MRSRNHIDAKSLTLLSNKIQNALGEYSKQNKHWHKLFSDPHKIKPNEFMLKIKKNIDDTSLRQRMDAVRSTITKDCHTIMQTIRNIIKHPSYLDTENRVGTILGSIDQLVIPTSINSSTENRDVTYFIKQIRACLDAVDRQALTDKVRLELNTVDECLRAVVEGLSKLETLNNEYFEIHINILKLLRGVSHNPQMNALLVEELSTLEESQWHQMKGDMSQKIKQALIILDEQRLYDSTDHFVFCKTWQVVGHTNQYPIWTDLLLSHETNNDLDDKCYGKIVCDFRNRFGLVDLANQDSAKFLNPSEKAALAKEIEIWSFKNITKYFSNYLFEFAIRHPNADVVAKGLEIKNELLMPLMKEVERAHYLPYINRTVFGKPEEWAKIFFDSGKSMGESLGNVQRIAAQREMLADRTPQLDGTGHVYFVPKNATGLVNKRSTTVNLHSALGGVMAPAATTDKVSALSPAVAPATESKTSKQEVIEVEPYANNYEAAPSPSPQLAFNH